MPLSRRAAALLLGLCVAAGALAAVELRLRADEAGFAWRDDARRFAVRPGVGGTNAAGYHDRDHGAPTGRRLVVVGDSVAWGSGPPAEAFPALAEAALPGWEVLNLAHYGYDAAQVAAVLATDGWAADPALVVWAAYTNDLVPTRFVEVGGHPVRVGSPTPLWRASAIVRRLDGAWASRGHVEAPDRAFLRAALAGMAADARGHDVPLLVFGLAPHVLAGGDGPACDARAAQPAGFCAEHLARARHVHEDAVALGLPAASALPWLRASGHDAFFPADGRDPHHPGREGHEVLAAALVEVLRRHAEGLPLPGPADPRP